MKEVRRRREPERLPFPPGLRIRSRDDYREQTLAEEDFHQLEGARVVFAEYDLLRDDFAPRFAAEDRTGIDRWLIEHAAIMSRAQAAQTVVNTPIAVSRRLVRAYRPPCYGRAAVVDTGDGWIDVKGVGVAPGAVPAHDEHSTGLLTLTKGVQEVLFERLVAAALCRAGGCTVVPSYALLDLGFDVRGADGVRDRACAIVRRAHARPRIQWGTEDPGPNVASILRRILMDLRRSGIDSLGGTWTLERRGDVLLLHAYRKTYRFEGSDADRVAALTGYRGRRRMKIQALNLQFTSGMREIPPRPELVDFGAFCARGAWRVPLYSPTTASYVAMIGEVTLPHDPSFVRAASRRLSPLVNVLPSLLASAYARGRRSGEEIRQRLLQFVDDAFGIPES